MAVISFPTSIFGVHIPGLSKAGGPLGALFSDPFGMEMLRYPEDLGSGTRAHYITFRIYDIKPFELEAGTDWSLKSDSNGVAGVWGILLDKGVGTAKSLFNKTSVLNPRLTQQVQEISLYIPDSVQFDYQASYGEIILNPLAEGNALSKLPGIVGGTAKTLSGIASSEVSQLFLKSQGIAINPNQQVIFDGIPLRTFSFEFIFMPKSKKETTSVRKIIEAFKMYSRPRTMEGSFGMAFTPPSIFEIDFRFLDGRNAYVNKIADSVVTNVEIDYAPNGWSTHQDGSPVNIKMKVDFKELSLIDRDGQTSVENGY